MEKKTNRGAMPERRNPENADLSILVYRLDELVNQNKELKVLVESGFVKQEGRVTALESRVGNLESWRAAKEAVEQADKSNKGGGGLLDDRLFKVIFTVLFILAGVLGLNVTGWFKG